MDPNWTQIGPKWTQIGDPFGPMIEQYKSSLEPPYFLSEENQNKQMISATAALLLASSIIAPATTQAKQQKYLQSSQCAYFLQQQAKVSVNNAIPYTAKSCGYMKAWASDYGMVVTCGPGTMSATVITGVRDAGGYTNASVKPSIVSVLTGTQTMSTSTCVNNPHGTAECRAAQTSIETAMRTLAPFYCLNSTEAKNPTWNCDTIIKPNPAVSVCAP